MVIASATPTIFEREEIYVRSRLFKTFGWGFPSFAWPCEFCTLQQSWIDSSPLRCLGGWVWAWEFCEPWEAWEPCWIWREVHPFSVFQSKFFQVGVFHQKRWLVPRLEWTLPTRVMPKRSWSVSCSCCEACVINYAVEARQTERWVSYRIWHLQMSDVDFFSFFFLSPRFFFIPCWKAKIRFREQCTITFMDFYFFL